MIKRALESIIKNDLSNKKATIILGARQVGKTTLLKMIFNNNDNKKNILWLSGDEPDVRRAFQEATSTRLSALIGNNEYLIIDEAQRISSIGLNLKLITDNISDVKVIATGSSSFELTSGIGESLAGRKREHILFPLSFSELADEYGLINEIRMLPHRLVFGTYPEVVTEKGNETTILKELVNSMLYKDILILDGIRNRDNLDRLLLALAYQIGSQVSYNEIAQTCSLSPKTVEKYIDILEKAFIVFRLSSYSKNLRNELKKSRKVYFWDTGIRNALIGDFSYAETRNDIGNLWENYIIAERLKLIEYRAGIIKSRFWRNQAGAELDYIEEKDGHLSAYEIKWNPKTKAKKPKAFFDAYPGSTFEVIHKDNFTDFLTLNQAWVESESKRIFDAVV